MCIASDEMTVSDEYRVKAADFRAKAEREKDPLFSVLDDVEDLLAACSTP